MAEKKRANTLQFLLIFAVSYLLLQFGLKTFFPDQYNNTPPTQAVVLQPVSTGVREGHHPEIVIKNTTAKDFALPSRCPMPPVDVVFIETAGSGETLVSLTTDQTVLPCVPLSNIPAGSELTVSLAPWKYSLFGKLGTYEVRLPAGSTKTLSGTGNVLSARIDIYQANGITNLFRTAVTKPMLNLLVFIASLLPGYNLGLAIILLTIIIKFILFLPTQHAMEGQKAMQRLQPELEALKRKHAGDSKKLQEETMKLWKTHKVNPFQSCLPMLIQFPILIGLFYVIRDGSVLELSKHLLYGPYQNITWHFSPWFLGLNLLEPNWTVFPALLVALQFLQMKLAFSIAKRKQQKDGKSAPAGQDMQQRMMLYGLPLMIGVFAFQFPAAVSVYWGVSTLFAIGQQVVVNRKN